MYYVPDGTEMCDIMNVKNVETGFWRYRQDRS